MPAPTVITDTEVAGVLKNVYANFREKVFPIITPLLANIQKGKPGGPRNMRWGGNGVYWDVVMGRPVGMTASAAGFFPPDAPSNEVQANEGVKRLYVTRQIDGLAITGTQSKDAAFVSLARKVLDEAKAATQLGMQEISHSDGRGIKAVLASSADTTHFVATSPYGITSSGQGGLLLAKGMYVAVYASDLTTLRGKASISGVVNSGDNATVTLATAVSGMVATDVVAAATTSDDSLKGMPHGLTDILNRGGSYNSLHGVSPATAGSERWDTTRLVAGTDTPDANQPTEIDVWDLATRVAWKSGHDGTQKPSEFLCLTTPGVRKKIAESFLGQRQIQMSDASSKIKGGFSAIMVNGMPVIADGWCPAGTLYLIHLPSLSWIDSKDWGQVEYEGAGPWRFIAGRDAYETSFGAYINFATLQRNSHGIITGYTDTVRYTFVQ